MANKRISSLQWTKAIILRQSQTPLWEISALTEISVSHLKRFFNDPSNRDICLSTPVVEVAKAEIVREMDSHGEISRMLKHMHDKVFDQLMEQSKNLDKSSKYISSLRPSNIDDVVKFLRAVQTNGMAYKTFLESLKLVSENNEDDDLPVLEVRVMNQDDVDAIRAQQKAEEELMGS